MGQSHLGVINSGSMMPRTATLSVLFSMLCVAAAPADRFAEISPRMQQFVDKGEAAGVVTSGTLSPSLGVGVAMGYVPPAAHAAGTRLQVDARGKLLDAVVTRPPFYTSGSIKR